MKRNQIYKLIYTALFITLGLVLPQLNKMVPIANIGAILLPMHIPVLLSGFVCGVPYAAFCGLILPLLNFVLTGMPVIYPVGISMMLELAAYGSITAILYAISNRKVWISLIGAMIGGRIMMGIANMILFGMAGKPYGLSVFLTSAFVTALPGIMIQLIIIPAIIYALRKANMMRIDD